MFDKLCFFVVMFFSDVMFSYNVACHLLWQLCPHVCSLCKKIVSPNFFYHMMLCHSGSLIQKCDTSCKILIGSLQPRASSTGGVWILQVFFTRVGNDNRHVCYTTPIGVLHQHRAVLLLMALSDFWRSFQLLEASLQPLSRKIFHHCHVQKQITSRRVALHLQ